MKFFIKAILFTTVLTSITFGQQLEKKWEGKILLSNFEFDIIVNFIKSDTGYSGTIDIIQQGAKDLPLANIFYNYPEIKFELPTSFATAYFSGSFINVDLIEGEFLQGGVKGTFNLKPYIEKVEIKEELPYQEEEITFTNGNNIFSGTLTIPKTVGRHPAVVLITGSGAQNRDEEIVGFKIFRVIADFLTRNGIAVLRYDDRNFGKSKGTSVDSSTTEDFAYDVIEAVKYLQSRNDINPTQIGLLGHSEGGIVAPLAATKYPDIAFIILMAGTGVKGKEIILEQTRAIMKANGETEEKINEATDYMNRLFKALETGEGMEELENIIKKQAAEYYESLPEEQKSTIKDKDEYIDLMLKSRLYPFKTRWMRFFLEFDPKTALEKVKCPTLAIFGELDLQVLKWQNEKPIEEALKKAGNKNYEIKTFEKANHLFQEAITGSPSEYAKLKKEFVSGFLEYITNWILKYTSQTR
ncbi:MAG: lysophospholipase [Ignavibacteria bacterium]|nr:lysophospholipase [Ignavibacteria bacterium]